jgi:hypothetical protein
MGDANLTQVLENLARERPARNIHFKCTEHQSKFAMVQRSAPLTVLNDYRQTSKGQRFFDRIVAFANGSKMHRAAYSDSTRCAEVKFHPDKFEVPVAIRISKQFMDDMVDNTLSIPFPLNSFYVGPKELIDALPAAERLPDGEVINRRCEVFLFRSVGTADRKEDFVYHLDKQTSVPLKVACYIKPEHVAIDRPYWAWEAKTLDDVGGHHLPLASVWTLFVVKDASREQPPKVNATSAITVDEVEFDRELPATAFWPAYREGVRVVDLTHRKTGDTQTVKKAVSAPDVIRVVEPGGIPWATLGGVFLIVAVIASAMALRTRLLSATTGRRPT